MIELLNCGLFSYGKDDFKENQDSILPPSKIGNGYIFAIADGVGSYKGAKLASQIAINHLSKMVLDHNIDIDFIFSAIKDEIFKISNENPDLYHSATTLTFCYVNNDNVHIGHIGDTRIYVKNKNKLIQLSKDHTVHQSLLDEKIYTKKELKNIKGKNKLTTAIS
ncbi:PP2C family protein-serine/threonine phosphatase, partial [Arsenophonus nasoniae]|uniref:PP2C family protein-serine/threonine phosphatase n=1 Tax=Arsenophonus nasoniae TaxID=638 RepID=UPI0004793A34